MRKLFLATTAAFSLLSALISGIAPASAITFQTTMPYEVRGVVGESINFSSTCSNWGETPSFSMTNIPPGISFDTSTGTISGTFTTPGVYDGFLGCRDPYAGQTGGYRFIIEQRLNPFFEVTALKDSACSVRVSVNGVLPTEAEWLQRNLIATLDNQEFIFRPVTLTPNYGSEIYQISYDDISGATLRDGRAVEVLYFDSQIDEWKPITPTQAQQITCGSNVDWRYDTNWRIDAVTDRQYVTATRGGPVAQPPAKPYLNATALNDARCSFLIEGYIPSLPDSDSVVIKMDQGLSAEPNLATLGSVEAGMPFKLVASLSGESDDIAAISGAQVVSSSYPQNLKCGDATDFELGYSSLTVAAPVATLAGRKAKLGKELAPYSALIKPTVQAEFVGGPNCTVRVSGYFPFGDLGLTNRSVTFFYYDGEGEELLEPLTIESDGFFEFTYNVDGTTNSSYNLLDSNGMEPECGQTVAFEANYSSGSETIIGDAVLVFAGQGTPCEIGTYSETGFAPCKPADRGFFVSTAGAKTQNPCSPGFYSAFLASSACVPAPLGTFVPVQGMPTPIPCYAGTYSSVTGATECIVTPINYYTRANASQAVACPAGTHTQESGSTSPRDCLPNSNQTANIKSLPAGLKFNQAIVVNKQSSAGLALAVSVRGNCSVVNASASTWRIVAGKAKGTCMVLIANSGGQGVNPFSLSRTLKISKNGK